MNWYKGNIAEAVTESKTKNAIFVVYVEGKDESSKKLTNFLNDAKIYKKLDTKHFVAIKIESDSQSYMQFASIYQVVPVPSIFFIGASGTPLEIGTAVMASVEELERKIDTVLAIISQNSDPSAAFLCGEREAAGEEPSTSKGAAVAGDEVVCEDGVCFRQSKPADEASTPAAAAAAVNDNDTADTVAADANALNDALEHARKALEQKRIERVEAEKKLEKEQELRRRREQKDVQKLNEWKKEQEYKEAIESRRRERLEEQAARQRILSKIAADKAERAQKFGMGVEDKPAELGGIGIPVASSTPSSAAAANAPDVTRLQFRFPNGDTSTQSFQRSDTLAVVRDYIKSELTAQLGGLKEFALATTYPKREFGPDDAAKSLTELALFPSAVVLVIGTPNRYTSVMSETNRYAIFTFLMNLLLSPFMAVYNYFTKPRAPAETERNNHKSRGTNSGNNEAIRREAAAKRRRLDGFDAGAEQGKDDGNAMPRRGGSSRRYGGSNIHRLSDSPKNSDDENATWNGNSTQQQ